ncbi:MAG TPA: ATP synthase F1 subunit epsilon [archaeon]|nr:ATP synthase F1 subunit epsilon [archaeon]
MSAILNTKVITQERVLFEGQAERLVVPAVNGYLGILPKHAPLMAALGNGVLKISVKKDNTYFAVFGGFLQVKDNRVIILADKAIAAANIDLAEAEKDLSELKISLESGGEGARDWHRLSREIELARVRSKAALLAREK